MLQLSLLAPNIITVIPIDPASFCHNTPPHPSYYPVSSSGCSICPQPSSTDDYLTLSVCHSGMDFESRRAGWGSALQRTLRNSTWHRHPSRISALSPATLPWEADDRPVSGICESIPRQLSCGSGSLLLWKPCGSRNCWSVPSLASVTRVSARSRSLWLARWRAPFRLSCPCFRILGSYVRVSGSLRLSVLCRHMAEWLTWSYSKTRD